MTQLLWYAAFPGLAPQYGRGSRGGVVRIGLLCRVFSRWFLRRRCATPPHVSRAFLAHLASWKIMPIV